MVVSVPNKNTCLSGEETKINLFFAGACDTFTALLLVPFDKSQRYKASSFLIARRSSPNVSRSQYVASSSIALSDLGVFQASKFHVPVPHPKPKDDIFVPVVI